MTFVGKLVVVDGKRVHDDYEDVPEEAIGYRFHNKPVKRVGYGMSHEDIEARRRLKRYGEYSKRYVAPTRQMDIEAHLAKLRAAVRAIHPDILQEPATWAVDIDTGEHLVVPKTMINATIQTGPDE